MTAGLTDPLASAKGTPLGPIAAAIARGDQPRGARVRRRSARCGWSTGAAAAAVRIETASARSRSGARIDVSGGDGVTYYWPSGRLRIDGEYRDARRRPADRARSAFASRAAARR